MNTYKCLNQNEFQYNEYKIVPIRYEDRLDIMKWRNEQIYHLRQVKPLTIEDQNDYFENFVSKIFEQEKPQQLLFSFLKEEVCIGYGGLVHINWVDKNAEISFIMNTEFEKENFDLLWSNYLNLIQEVAFSDLNLHKIFTFAFDLRPDLYQTLEKNGFYQEAILMEHCKFDEQMINVFIHAKINDKIYLTNATIKHTKLTYSWANNPIIRQYSFNKNSINYPEHIKWFTSKIMDSYCDYFILYKGLKPLGSIRIDYNNDYTQGTISYLIDTKYHGQSFGKTILQKIEESILQRVYLKNVTLIGFVKNENIASVKIFNHLNYIKTEVTKELIKFEKKIYNEN
jgi:RimJ/RimL family protein N-acetyltransferase